MDFIILLSAVLKHVVICRKLQKIAPFGIVIDLWKCGVCVCVSVCVHNSSLIISKNSENTEKCKELHQLETSMVGLIEHVPHDSLYYILMGDDRMHIFL